MNYPLRQTRQEVPAIDPCYTGPSPESIETVELVQDDLFCIWQHRYGTRRISTDALALSTWAMVLQQYTQSTNISLALRTSEDELDHVRHCPNPPVVDFRLCQISHDRERSVHSVLKDTQTMISHGNSQEGVLYGNASKFDFLRLGRLNTALWIGEDPSCLDLEKVFVQSSLQMLAIFSKDDSAQSWTVSIQYSTASVTQWQATNMAQTWSSIIREMLYANPRSSIGSLNAISEQDVRQIHKWNPATPASPQHLIHEMIIKRGEKQPHAIAIDSWDGRYTYKELLSLSHNLASRLKMAGIQPGVYVPLCFEKTRWAIVAQLAVLIAGGAFVPLDPAQPLERLRAIVNEVQATFILTSPHYQAKAESIVSSSIVVNQVTCSEPDTTTLRQPDSSEVGPDDVAYAIFTSGSTGVPKGVLMQHAACCYSASTHGRAMHFSTKTRALQYALYSFDASIAEILTTLIFGGVIVVPSDWQRMNAVASVIREKSVNWMFSTPSLLSLIDPEEVPTLRTLVVGGEAVGTEVVATWSKRAYLMNGYGPTETCVFCTTIQLTPRLKGSVIGRPLGGLAWIVNPKNPHKLMPIGTIGELLIESPALARGYMNQSQTDAAFITDPPWLHRSARMYKTGDLVRYDCNGRLEYLGRKDSQIKLRGQRIELAEIEFNLKKANGHGLVAVELHKPSNGSPYLLAFCEIHDSAETSRTMSPDATESIQKQLRSTLPAYMVPSKFILLKSMPLNSNGKIDRKTLRSTYLSGSQIDSGDTRMPLLLRYGPDKLSELWADVLSLDATSTSDPHFFQQGGDSITAMKLVAKAAKAGLCLTVADIFKSPRLKDLRHTVKQRSTSHSGPTATRPFSLMLKSKKAMLGEAQSLCQVGESHIDDIYPATPMQSGFIALSTIHPDRYFAQHVLQLSDGVDLAQLQEAWNIAYQMNPALRTRIIPASDSYMQVVIHETIKWSSHHNLDEYLQSDREQVFTTDQPLCRFATIMESNEKPATMVFTAHHAIHDGHSLQLILACVHNAYKGIFAESTLSFRDFIAHSTLLDSSESQEYWRKSLDGATGVQFPVLPDPTYKPNADSQVRSKIMMPTLINSSTPKSALLRAAWALTLMQYSGATDVVFGTTLSGRNMALAGIETTTGPTLTTVPLRINIDPAQSTSTLLKGVQQQAIDMMPHEQTGIQEIMRLSADCRDACNFQSFLIIQPEPEVHDGTVITSSTCVTDLSNFNPYGLMLQCALNRTTVELEASFDSNLLNATQVRRVLDYFYLCVELLARNQDATSIRDLQLLSAADKVQIKAWNRNAPSVYTECAHKLVEAKVMEQPDKIAVDAWDGQFSYSALDNLAGILSHHLMNLGVVPEQKVIFCMEKTKWSIVSIYGILKAGGAVVPMDPSHPEARRQTIAKIVDAHIVLTSEKHKGLFDGTSLKVLAISQAFIDKLSFLDSRSSEVVRPDHAATVLFTSGSTGVPKGIVQEHTTVSSAALNNGPATSMSSQSRTLQFASHTFDVATIEITNTLILGGTLCIPSDEDRMNNLAAFVNKFEANWAFLTPSFAQRLNPDDMPSLTTVTMGGEAVTKDNVAQWAGKVQLYNGYGPAEGSICVAGNLSDGSQSTESMGWGCGCLCWIVDPSNPNYLLPIGATGELLLEGPNVARGYIGDQIKTRASFIEPPNWVRDFPQSNDSPRNRFYRTGDLVKYNSDGSITYVGRIDNQVKIRGQRVELGEIEHQILRASSDATEVAVDAIVLPNNGNTKTLIAFMDRSKSLTTKDFDQMVANLPQSLISHLPSYMIPDIFIPVDGMPYTTSQKLDRRALREHAKSLSLSDISRLRDSHRIDNMENATSLSGNTVALQLAHKVLELTGQNQIDTTHDQKDFHLQSTGLDSIHMMLLATFVKKQFGISLPMSIYTDSTMTASQLAQHIQDGPRVLCSESNDVDLLGEFNNLRELTFTMHTPHLASKGGLFPIASAKSVFVTGGTGFLGSQILRQLFLRDNLDHIVVLVRGTDPRERLIESAKTAGWWSEEYNNKLEVWSGDLALPRLGLNQEQWDRLCSVASAPSNIDAIIHNGAVVNWNADYAMLKAPNVMSTIELLSAVSTWQKTPRMCFVSGGHLWVEEDDDARIAESLRHGLGYSQTKFASELLVKDFARRVPQSAITVVKPGLILGSSDNGVAQTDDFLWRVVAGSVGAREFCQEQPDSWITMAGSDQVAKIVVERCIDGKSGDKIVTKILDGMKTSDMWQAVIEQLEVPLQSARFASWIERIQSDVERDGSEHKLFPVLDILRQKQGMLGGATPKTVDLQIFEADVKLAFTRSLQYLLDIEYLERDGKPTRGRQLLDVPKRPVFTRSSLSEENRKVGLASIRAKSH